MIVVVGGAGYIGSVVVEDLVERGFSVTVIDDLSLGHSDSIPDNVEFFNSDMANTNVIRRIASENDVEAVMHFAALAWVGESVKKPKKYWNHNVKKSIEMIDAWVDAGVDRFIFSSTAATYGEPEYLPIDEDHPQNPINPYGRTKLACEWYLDDRYQADGVKSVSLRYFNAAGAGDMVGEDHDPETHLIPNLLNAALDGETFHLYGTDYDTRDGTCLRDFVHVKDLASAHHKALDRLDNLQYERINLGTSTGYTVREVTETVRSVTGEDFPVTEDEPRSGDPARLVASNDKAKELLDWSPERDIEAIVEEAWRWKQNHPQGYEDSSS
jgi:UDP-glucose 4-epimerase